MAAIDTSRPVAVMSAAGFTTFFANAFASVSAWNDSRVTRKSLSSLTARELEDIGLSFADIEKVASHSKR